MTSAPPLDRLNQFVLDRTWRIALFLVAAISLLAMLAYPFGYDQAAFFVGGEMIVENGAIPYRDLIDTKPPLIFYFYGIASFIFGHNQWGIRLMDVMWQVATALLLYGSIRKHTASESIAYLTAFLFVWQYATMGYWMTAQAESFAILPTLLILKWVLDLDDRTAFRFGLYSGLALAAVLLLKFTLVLFFAGVIIYLIKYRHRSESIPYLAGSLLTFGLAVGGYILHLHVAGGLDNFVEGIRWVQHYASITGLFDLRTIAEGYTHHFPAGLFSSFGISLILAAFLGVIVLVRASMQGDRRVELGWASLFALCAFFALLGVMYERKFFPYHYIRAHFFITPFAAIGIVFIISHLRIRKAQWIYVVPIVLMALFFSPVLRSYSQTARWSMAALTGADREAIVQEKIKNYYAMDQKMIGEYLRPLMTDQDQIFFWGNGVGAYFFADRLPTTFALTNTPFVTEWTSPKWKTSMMEQLGRSQPRYFIVEQDDAREFISSSTLDSYEHMKRWSELDSFVSTGYREEKRIGHFIIYRRI